jgi:sulfotransferase family protein
MTSRAETIRIDDLRAPVLTPAQLAALEEAERHPVRLSVDAVLDAATREEGLSDFGPDDFRFRLALWLSEIDEDDRRTAWCRRRMYLECVRLACNRLRVVNLLGRHPEIHDVRVTAPVIVVGMPRTGTTHLVNTLAADRRFRSLPLWESREPVPKAGPRGSGLAVDERRRSAQAAWEEMLRVNPNGAAMHAMHPDHIHEELELECIDFSSYRMEWSMQCLPGWRDYYLSSDQTPHYEFLRTMLKILQWQRGPERWILKCPQHLEQLPVLMKTFPDALVVMTHRDPVSVVQSAATMMASNARMTFRSVDADGIFGYWADRIGRLLAAGVRDVGVIPDGRRVDIGFDELMRGPAKAVLRVYEAARIPMSADAEAMIRQHLTENPRGKEGKVVYDLRRDFGVVPDELRRRFDDYLERFRVTAETP